MKRIILIVLAVVAFGMSSNAQQDTSANIRDIFPDTWVGTDALGRKMPLINEAGSVKTDHPRIVGLFYITWHTDDKTKLIKPYKADVSYILSKDSNARVDANNPLWKEKSYHWGEPELGYFLSRDRYVIRKDMSMLSDAGVDVIIFDVTNAVRYWDEWDTILSEMEKMKAEGNKVPKFCFWAFNGPVITVVQNIYDRIYKANKYKDLWFYWQGRPLILYNGTPLYADATSTVYKNPNPNYEPGAAADQTNSHYGDRDYTETFFTDYSNQVKEFFTTRTMWWGYYMWAGKRFVGTNDNWAFGYDLGDKKVGDLSPSQLASVHDDKIEEMAVTPAQHPAFFVGKSWSRQSGEPKLNSFDLPVPTYVPWLKRKVDHPEGYGIYFQERWNEALSVGPSFLYLNDWNEWTAGKYEPKPGGTFDFMRRKNSFFFVDQYNSEFNRSIQPMNGGYTDNYYMQMAENIRLYKGVRPIPELHGSSQIEIDGRFEDWDTIKVEYRDTKGDVIHRDFDGYGGTHYIDTSGRNDIITCKVAVDQENVYFYAETDKSLTPSTGKNWMLLLIDADKNSNTGWYGYDYIINKSVNSPGSTTLMHYEGTSTHGRWKKVCDLKYKYAGNKLEIAVPKKLLNLFGPSFTFDFHWSDNPDNINDPISLATSGDSAPNRRFNYRCIWNKN
jgi:hypothetical protein